MKTAMKTYVTIKVDSSVKDLATETAKTLRQDGLKILPPELIAMYEIRFGRMGQLSNSTIFGLALLSLRSRIK